MALKTFTLQRDNTSRRVWPNGAGQGRGTNDRLLIGKVKIAGKQRKVRSFVKWDLSFSEWSGVEIVTQATLTLTVASNAGDTELAPGSGSKVSVFRLKKGFSEGSGGNWSSGAFVWPALNGTLKRSGNGSATPDATITINMLPLLRKVAPKKVAFILNGKKVNGLGYTDKGFAIKAEPEWSAQAATEVWSQEYGTASKRPTLEIVYEQVNTPPSAAISSPSGNTTADFDITGTFDDINTNDYMTKVRVQIEKNSVGNWDTPIHDVVRQRSVSAVDDLWHLEHGSFSKKLWKGTVYKMRAKVYDKKNKNSDWSATRTFTIVANSPTVTCQDFGNLTTMNGAMLGGAWTKDNVTTGLGVDIQVLTGGVVKWNLSRPMRQDEKDTSVVSQEYAGPTLYAGAHTYKVRVTDALGGQSTWDEGTFTLTADEPDTEEDLQNITGYSPVPAATRIVLKDMNPKSRGPRKVVGVIENASNIGLSWYATAPGELYFTLPTTHPQVSVCEPLTTHYSFQQYSRGVWKVLASGILHDFHAQDDEVIFYGIDYLGLLAWSIEAAKQPASNHKKNMPGKPKSLNGSRYFKKTIKKIIRNQLYRAREQDNNSPVKFIQTGDIGNFNTRITIYASYVQRLEFIRGLIESHKGAITTGGGERRSRLRVRYHKGKKRWQFDALDNVGSDRDNIRIEYGGLLQGYNVRAMGDYANIIYAAGKEPNKVKPQFAKQSAPGVSQTDWGSIGRAAFWSDITDHQDLTRRARSEAIRASRVGKQIALGLRVQGLGIWDGYDILDNIPISIDDGVVDTSQYGSGYWTIWGGEYRVFDDGHDEVTLIVRPKGDGAAIDTDLIGTDPIHAHSDWKWGSGAPTG